MVGVEADSGAIGGASSKEFMVTADIGEDSILFTQSGSYAANIEKAVSIPSKPIPLKDNISGWLETPQQKTILEICKKNNLDPSQIIKVVVFLATFENKSDIPILACIRGDQHINEIKLFNVIDKLHSSNLLKVKKIEDKIIIEKNLVNFPLGFIGPDLDNDTIKTDSNWDKKWTRIIDHSASDLSKFISGGNKVNFHKVFQEFSFLRKTI